MKVPLKKFQLRLSIEGRKLQRSVPSYIKSSINLFKPLLKQSAGKLLRNVVALRNVNAMFVCEKLKHFANSLNFYWDELDPAEHTKERL